eukprot:751736-Prymnesium_polylepis.1
MPLRTAGGMYLLELVVVPPPRVLVLADLVVRVALGRLVLVGGVLKALQVLAPLGLGGGVAAAPTGESREAPTLGNARREVGVAAHLVLGGHVAADGALDVRDHLRVRGDLLRRVLVLLADARLASAPDGVGRRPLAVQRLGALHVGGRDRHGGDGDAALRDAAGGDDLVPGGEHPAAPDPPPPWVLESHV